jgi:UDP-N-acetylglucosamine:LPS N-acetylglucosamine transferase
MSWAPAIYGTSSRIEPRVYNAVWDVTNDVRKCRMAADALYAVVRRRLKRLLQEAAPDLVVVTHPLFLAEIIARARAELAADFRLATVVADPMNPHASWASPSADVLFTVSAEAAARILGFGISERRIEPVSFPVDPAFLLPPAKEVARRRIGLPNGDSPAVLVAGGGAGSGTMWRSWAHLRSALPNIDIMLAPGGNRRLRRAVQSDPRTFIVGHRGSMLEAIAAADVVISKAGPSTIFESLAVGVPLVITSEVGRQEEGNATFAERYGAATAATQTDLTALVGHAVAAGLRTPRPGLANGAEQIAAALLPEPHPSSGV